jgi:hypothetical protein
MMMLTTAMTVLPPLPYRCKKKFVVVGKRRQELASPKLERLEIPLHVLCYRVLLAVSSDHRRLHATYYD